LSLDSEPSPRSPSKLSIDTSVARKDDFDSGTNSPVSPKRENPDFRRMRKRRNTYQVRPPAIFRDKGWKELGQTILSTSNCGNPSLRLFGFGPVSSNGFGIGYIIKDDGIQYCVSSKHRQTGRYIETLEKYLCDVQDLLISTMPRSAATSFNIEKAKQAEMDSGGYGFFDAGDIVDDVEKELPPIGRRLC